MKLKFGISTCPNDTFLFHGIINNKVDLQGLEFDFSFLDVQELNDLLAAGELDCSKASFHAALHLADTYKILPVGAALGEGVGPILLGNGGKLSPESKILCPGAWTTATLLFSRLHPECQNVEHRIFSEIMPALVAGEADCGVVIHEGRFTYQDHGLTLIEDLGESWEKLTGGPVPLGGLLAKRSLPDDIVETVTTVLRLSLHYGWNNREETFATMQGYAQELSAEAIWKHVDLYVNSYTEALGEVGLQAVSELSQRLIQ